MKLCPEQPASGGDIAHEALSRYDCRDGLDVSVGDFPDDQNVAVHELGAMTIDWAM